MAIQNRRGAYTDFDPTKMVPGEYAIVQEGDPDGADGLAIYMCFVAGTVKRITTVDDLAAALSEYTIAWTDVTGKPSVFPTNWTNISGKPAISAGTAPYSIIESSGANASGANSHAEGNGANASGAASHAEGSSLAAGANSHAEGENTAAFGLSSHSEGYRTSASGQYGHAEGNSTTAYGHESHAEGLETQAIGNDSHAEGVLTRANGDYSHSEGSGTIASGEAQHVFGKNNIEDQNDTYVEIVGNGSSRSARANARTLDWNGNEVLAGKLTVGAGPTSDMDVTTKEYVDEALSDAISFTDPNNDGNVVISLT